MPDDRSTDEQLIDAAELRRTAADPARFHPSVHELSPDRAQIAALGNLPSHPIIPPEIVLQVDLHAFPPK